MRRNGAFTNRPHCMRQRPLLFALFAGLLLAAGALVLPSLIGANDVPLVRWEASEEIAIEAQGDQTEQALAEALGADGRREQVEAADDLGAEQRSELLLRGRVVNRFRAPVADAKVWLDFGRGSQRGRGRDRRVPEPVQTDSDGRFAFQGQTFRNLRVNLLVVHGKHAPTQFERNLGEVGSELDLGELAMNDGGELLGRVVDMSGNGIPFADVKLQPDGDNWMRFQRDRDDLLKGLQTDANGYFLFVHVANGEWRVAAGAKNHENGTSEQVEAAENQRAEVPDIVLGPGFEISGLVSDQLGKPIADAEVVARPRNQSNQNGRGGRGGRGPGGPGAAGAFGGGGSEQTTRTDKDGRFFFERLPDALLDISARKQGYLPASANELDPEQVQPVYMTLEDGLAIRGVVTDALDAKPVTRYSITAQWIRPLPETGQAQADMRNLMAQLRDETLDEATRAQVRTRVEAMRQQIQAERGDGPQNARGGRGNRDNRAERHPDGRFAETGLAEGVYAVSIDSDAHAIYRSAEIELRNGIAAPELQIALERGFVVSGLVQDHAGKPIANARVRLERPAEPSNDPAAPATEQGAQNGRGGRGNRGNGGDLRARFAAWQNGPLPSAETDAKGVFQIEHAPSGSFVVRASANAHEDAETKPFVLASDTKDVLLALQRRGSLSGRILGATKAELDQVRVVAVPTGDGADVGAMFRGGNPFASVSSDGTYAFEGLRAGSYAVRAFLGSSMRDLMGQYQRGELLADVSIVDGEAATLDVTILPPQTGIVRGSVLHNGTPADGFTVTLQLVAEDGANEAPSPFGGRGGRGGMGMRTTMTGRVDSQGRFSIDEVQKGSYTLSVSADRRSSAVHKESIVVVPQGTVDVTIQVATSSIEGSVEATDGTTPADISGAIALLPGATEMPADFSIGGRGGQGGGPGAGNASQAMLRARIANGKFAFAHVPPGNYLAVVTVRGRIRTSAQVTATLGQKGQAVVPLGAVDPNAQQTPQRQPGQGGQRQPGASPTPGQPGQPGGGDRANRQPPGGGGQGGQGGQRSQGGQGQRQGNTGRGG